MGIKNNINITFPDGNKREFEKGITGYQIAESIAKSLAKEAIAINIDGIQKDLCDQIDSDSSISIITINTDEGLDIMRHTLPAQVLAKAVKTLYPEAKLAIGPTIEHGFYYDVLFEKPISSEDLPKIEKEMNKIISNGEIINKKICSKKDAIKLFEERNETYKIDIINNSDQDAHWLMGAMDYQDGYAETYYGGSGHQSWSWKRGLGMDVVCYRGTGESRTIKHNLGVAPEMIWIKRRAQSGNSGDWMVGHKDLYGGTNPWSYYLVLNKEQAEANDFAPFDSFAPTVDAFGVGTSNRVNNNDDEYVAYLFASVPGFSKIGTYAGQNTNYTLDLGFTPRFFLCKARTQPQSTYWAYFDSVRGISSGTTPRLSLNVNNANDNGSYVSTTSS